MALKPRPVEVVLAGYALVVVITSLVRLGERPGAGWIAVGHGLIIVLMGLLQLAPASRFGVVARAVAPIVLLFALYGAIDVLNGVGGAPTHDRIVRGWEVAIFGGEPATDWWHRWPSRVASSVFHAAYCTYYVLVPLPIGWFLARRRPDLARQALFPIMTAFVLCYLVFIWFPVAGPYYEFARPAAWFLDNGPARLVYGILATGSSFGAAFPSSHVAATWAAVLATARGAPRMAAWMAIPAGLLTIGVVYCQMHYAVDAAAGLVVALAAAALAHAFEPGTT